MRFSSRARAAAAVLALAMLGVLLTPMPASAAGARVTVATFNVRTAETEVQGHEWEERKSAIARQIKASGATVVALQEAGTLMGDRGTASGDVTREYYWQFQELRDAVGGSYALADETEYSYQGAGKEGTRILYNAAKVTMLDHGFFAPSTVDSFLRFVPWARFQDRASGKTFYFISVHLDNRESKYALRLKQITTIIAKARSFAKAGGQVIVAGDFNSNAYSHPRNGIAIKLTKSGFHDAYKARKVVNKANDTFNDFLPPRSTASRTDYIMTYGGPKTSYAYKNWVVRSGTIPSDHYMQSATVAL